MNVLHGQVHEEKSTDRTTRWLKLHGCSYKTNRTALSIVQGGFYDDLRVEHAQEIVDLSGCLCCWRYWVETLQQQLLKMVR